jgi:hypothetical protein
VWWEQAAEVSPVWWEQVAASFLVQASQVVEGEALLH